MFIDNMSGLELLNEYKADLQEIKVDAQEFDASRRMNDLIRKNKKKKEFTAVKTSVSKRGNKYLGILIYTREGIRTWRWRSYHIGLMNTKKGLMALAFFADDNVTVKYTPHFFRRYKERMLSSDIDWTLRNELIKADTQKKIVMVYIKRNLGTVWVETGAVYKEKNHIVAPTHDGVTLLQWSNTLKVYQANTFVTYNMLSDKQREMLKKLSDGQLDGKAGTSPGSVSAN